MEDLDLLSDNETVFTPNTKVDTLIFLFHGYGSNKENLLPIAEAFSQALPNAEIHIPNGLDPCEESDGYKWFSMNSNILQNWESEFEQNAPIIMNYVEKTAKNVQLSYKDIIFAGFSQGAMLSLSLGIYYNIKAVISFSGLILNPQKYLKHTDTKVLLTHGEDDSVIPVSSVDFTKFALERFTINTQTVVAPGLDHSINQYLLNQAMDFLRSL